MKNLTVNEAIELAANLGFDSEDLKAAFDISKMENEKIACAFLLIAMEDK